MIRLESSKSVAEVADLLGGTLSPAGIASTMATGWVLDNRSAEPGSIFLAIKGEHVDGHDFAKQAIESGAVCAVVERDLSLPEIIVQDLKSALAAMAATLRKGWGGTVVGVTGSAGKTTTKELISAAVGSVGPVVKSGGNQNTEWTNPLVYCNLKPSTAVLVSEMAMRGLGQIAHLASFASPNIGVITNIGQSHLEFLGSRMKIAEAKGELFEALPTDGLAVAWAEDDFLEFLQSKSEAETATFGFSETANCRIESVAYDEFALMNVTGKCDGKHWTANLRSLGRHFALNSAAAILVASRLGVDPQVAADAISHVPALPLRMQIVEWRGATLLVDAYNAAPNSMRSALETLKQLPVANKRRAIIGAMRELGPEERPAHLKLADELLDANVQSVWATGEPARATIERATEMGIAADWAPSTDDLKPFLDQIEEGDVVLVKGSRAFELEKLFDL